MRLKEGEKLVAMAVLTPAEAAAVAAQRAALEADEGSDGDDDDAGGTDDDGAADTGPEATGPWLVVVTARGLGKRVALARFRTTARGAGGTAGIRLNAGDSVALAAVVRGKGDEVLIASRGGQMARFSAADIRCPKGRASKGVRLLSLKPGDEVQAATVLPAAADEEKGGGV